MLTKFTSKQFSTSHPIPFWTQGKYSTKTKKFWKRYPYDFRKSIELYKMIPLMILGILQIAKRQIQNPMKMKRYQAIGKNFVTSFLHSLRVQFVMLGSVCSSRSPSCSPACPIPSPHFSHSESNQMINLAHKEIGYMSTSPSWKGCLVNIFNHALIHL